MMVTSRVSVRRERMTEPEIAPHGVTLTFNDHPVPGLAPASGQATCFAERRWRFPTRLDVSAA